MAKTRNQNYDIALNGQGYILENKPEQPLILTSQEDNFLPRIAQGDRNYTDLAQWWYWTQIDFSSGIQESGLWKDTATYKEGSRNVDPFTVYTNVTLLKNPVISTTGVANANEITIGVYGQVTTTPEVGFYVGIKATSVAGADGARVYKSTNNGVDWSLVKEIATETEVHDLFIPEAGTNRVLCILTNNKWWIYNGGGLVDLTTTITAVSTANFMCGTHLANVLYLFTGVGNTPHMIKITGAWGVGTATVMVTYPTGSAVYDAKNFNGKIYYLLRRAANYVELRTYDGTTDVLVKSFAGLETPSALTNNTRYNRALVISPGGDYLLMFLTDGTRIFTYSIDTSNTITLQYRDIAATLYMLGQMAVTQGNRVYYGNLIIDDLGTGSFAFHNGQRNADNNGYFIPLAANETTMLFTNYIGQSNDAKIYTTSGSVYYSTGYIITSEFGVVSGLDKIFNSIILSFKKLAAGESILTEYSTDGGTTYTTVDTISYANDGGTITSKKIFFPANVVAKRMTLRFTLTAGTSQATTPTLQSYTVQYLPFPDFKQRFKFTVKCIDEMQRKDGSKEPKDGLWLRNTLRNSWWTKEVLDFEGYDSPAQELLDGNLTASATTIPVQGTTDFFPEIGRILIGQEEILYSGKTKTSFLSCTRGARNTVAAAHLDDANISVIYKVLISNYSESLILANNPVKPEYRVTLELKEV